MIPIELAAKSENSVTRLKSGCANSKNVEYVIARMKILLVDFVVDVAKRAVKSDHAIAWFT